MLNPGVDCRVNAHAVGGEKWCHARLLQLKDIAKNGGQAIVGINLGRLRWRPRKVASERECLQHGQPNVGLFEDPVEIGASHDAVVAHTSIMACPEIEERRQSRRKGGCPANVNLVALNG